jgi:hypothetical protein
LDTAAYPAGLKLSDSQLAQIKLRRDKFHGDWTYEFIPAYDYVISRRTFKSGSDRLPVSKEQMGECMANGAKRESLIDPEQPSIIIYRHDGSSELLTENRQGLW